MERGDKEKVTLVLDEGCRDVKAGKAIEGMWRKRFCSPEKLARVRAILVSLGLFHRLLNRMACQF